MKTTIDLIPGLPRKELVERIHFHYRQGEVSDRAVGFYLLDMQRRKEYRPFKDASEWARKHLGNHDTAKTNKLILLALYLPPSFPPRGRCLEELPKTEAAFDRGEVPWTKIREIARIARPDTEQVWLDLARSKTSREIEEEVRGKKRGDRPGEGLKARREKHVARFLLQTEQKVIWERAVRKLMAELGNGATPGDAAAEMARRALLLAPEAVPPRKAGADVLVVYHVGRDGRRWLDGEDGRIDVDRETIEEKLRAGARTLEVRDIEGAGVCTAIRFGEQGKVAPEDRDRPVSPELKAAVLARDGCCLICGSRENLTPHHLDSHADGGRSDMDRLVALCLSCQGAVHAGEIVLRVEEDGTLTALDSDGKVVGRFQSAGEVLADAGEACPLETVVRREAPAPAADPENSAQCTPESALEASPEPGPAPEPVAAERRPFHSLHDLPAELTAAQWRALEARIEWSHAQRAFLFRPEDDGLLVEATAAPATAEDSPPAGAAPVAPGVRPGTFDEFVGQRRVVENLLLAARAANARGEPMGHVLLSGQPGLGKTTVARLLARECGAKLEEVLAGNIGDPHQLISLLSHLPRGGIVLVDEVHGLERASEECLYTALEDGVLEVVLREGARTRALRVRLEPFTLVAATTRLGALSEPFRARFRLRERLEPYSEEEIAELVARAAARLGAPVSPEAAREVARRSKGTPREAIRQLEMARDVSEVSRVPASDGPAIHLDHVFKAAERLGIDEHGLDPTEQAAVKLLLDRGRPMGVEAMASQLGVDLETFRAVHEPWLERSGLVERTERGRVATAKARAQYGTAVETHAEGPEVPPRSKARALG